MQGAVSELQTPRLNFLIFLVNPKNLIKVSAESEQQRSDRKFQGFYCRKEYRILLRLLIRIKEASNFYVPIP